VGEKSFQQIEKQSLLALQFLIPLSVTYFFAINLKEAAADTVRNFFGIESLEFLIRGNFKKIKIKLNFLTVLKFLRN
jgi:hypothetical protein